MPISRAVRWMRRAISPRLAISNFRMPPSHPEDAELARAADLVRVHDGERYPEHGPAVARVDDSVVEEPTAGEGGERFALDLVLDGAPAAGVGLLVEGLSCGGRRLARHDRERSGELLGAHHGGLRIGPEEEKSRFVGAAGHAVVTRA